MADVLKINVNLKSFDDYPRFLKDFRKNIIENGFDEPIKKSIPELKRQLKFIINDKIRHIDSMAQPEVISDKNQLEAPRADISKSESTIMEYLTDMKSLDYNKAKNFLELNDSKAFWGQRSRNVDKSHRITLRIPITPGDTVENQRTLARNFFSEAIIAIPQDDGGVRYFKPLENVNIDRYLKIVCSSKEGYSEEDRFDQYKTKERKDSDTPYAEWTVYQSFLDQLPNNNNYVEITDIENTNKNGEFEEATILAKDKLQKTGSKKVEELVQKTENIENKSDLTPSVAAYRNTISLINNIDIEKKITTDRTTYSLVSDYEDFTEEEKEFEFELLKAVRDWMITYKEEWWKEFIRKVHTLIKKYGF